MNTSSVRLLLECQRFTAEGNFDHISAAIVAMYVFLADSLNTKRLVEGNTENNHNTYHIHQKYQQL
jgi:hypothetical protein